MMDLTRKPPEDAPLGAHEQYLRDFMSAMDDGLEAVRVVANGGAPDVDALDGYAQALEALRVGAVSDGRTKPTEDDVRNARHVVQLAREGAPSAALVEPARRAARVVTDGWDLGTLESALFCLGDEALRVQHLGRIHEVLDSTIALFERGCRAGSFVSTPEDIANVRRLQEIASVDGCEAQAERLRLVQELKARLPPGSMIDDMGSGWAVKSLYLDRYAAQDRGPTEGSCTCKRGQTDAEEDLFDDPLVLNHGERTALAIAAGRAPDVERLERFARALDVLRRGLADGTMKSLWLVPTEEDVRAAQHLVQLLRGGAPQEALAGPAQRVYVITANPTALLGLCGTLPWLAGEATRITRGDTTPRPDVVLKVLDDAVAFFERGGNVLGFVPTPDDLARVRRLREIAMVESGEELAERHRLAKELWARMPQDSLSDGIRRWAMRVGRWPGDEEG